MVNGAIDTPETVATQVNGVDVIENQSARNASNFGVGRSSVDDVVRYTSGNVGGSSCLLTRLVCPRLAHVVGAEMERLKGGSGMRCKKVWSDDEEKFRELQSLAEKGQKDTK